MLKRNVLYTLWILGMSMLIAIGTWMLADRVDNRLSELEDRILRQWQEFKGLESTMGIIKSIVFEDDHVGRNVYVHILKEDILLFNAFNEIVLYKKGDIVELRGNGVIIPAGFLGDSTTFHTKGEKWKDQQP